MKLIPLTQGQFAQVDDWNYDLLMKHKWFAQKHRGTFYATRRVTVGPYKQKVVFMHREIMNTPDDLKVDHIDHDGLNCLEENMRNCTEQQNCMNRSPRGRSEYLGVHFDVRKRKSGRVVEYIAAKIKVNGKQTHLGRFKTEEEASRAYDAAAMKHFGEFANLNFK